MPDMKREIVITALAVAGILHRPNGVDVGTSDHHHIEPYEAISPTIAPRTEAGLRPVAAPPFNNSAAFTDPITSNWQPQIHVGGSPLALLAS
jgi:hypothetical protein